MTKHPRKVEGVLVILFECYEKKSYILKNKTYNSTTGKNPIIYRKINNFVQYAILSKAKYSVILMMSRGSRHSTRETIRVIQTAGNILYFGMSINNCTLSPRVANFFKINFRNPLTKGKSSVILNK